MTDAVAIFTIGCLYFTFGAIYTFVASAIILYLCPRETDDP